MNFIDFKYFKAPVHETYFEMNNETSCFICGKNDSPQILPDYSLTIILPDIENATSLCLRCLLEKKYAFEHNAEGGSLTKDGVKTESEIYPCLKKSDDYSEALLPKEKQLLGIDISKVKELMHTPPYRAFNGASWLLHCNDFMTFTGLWEHEDFIKNSPDGNAKKYFDQIVDNWNGNDFYDRQFGPDKSEYAESIFYAFECLHCKVHRGYVE